MGSLSNVGLGLSLVFGFLLLALVAELYYLLWWKRRFTNREIEDGYGNSPAAREFLYMFCWKKPSSLSSTTALDLTSPSITEAHLCHDPELLLKPFEEGGLYQHHHHLLGPPRFLYTIKEETKEEMESEVGKSHSELVAVNAIESETPFWTPLASPPYLSPPLTPNLETFSPARFSFRPLSETSTELVPSRGRLPSSPPPKFRFLKEAEEKLQTKSRLAQESDEKGAQDVEDRDGSFITIFLASKSKEKVELSPHATSSQVLPLASSPSTLGPPSIQPERRKIPSCT